MRQVGRLKILHRRQVHPIGGLPAGDDRQTHKIAAVQQPRAFRTHHVFRDSPRRKVNRRIQHVRIVGQLGGPFPRPLRPFFIDVVHGRRRLLVHHRRLARKVGRRISGLHLHLLVGLDFDKPARRQFVRAVSFRPHFAPDGIRDIIERNRLALSIMPLVPIHRMVVVQLRRPHAQRDIEVAAVAPIARFDGAERSRQRLALLIGDRVVHVVRRRIGLLLQDGEIALQFIAQNIEQRRSRGSRQRERGKDERKQKAGHELSAYQGPGLDRRGFRYTWLAVHAASPRLGYTQFNPPLSLSAKSAPRSPAPTPSPSTFARLCFLPRRNSPAPPPPLDSHKRGWPRE